MDSDAHPSNLELAEPRRPEAPDVLSLLSWPWVLTQSHPLTTSQLIDEAGKRGLTLDPATLRELYRRGDLIPLVELTTRRVNVPREVPSTPPPRSSTLWAIHDALSSGKIRDLSSTAYRPRLRFGPARVSDPRGWWNGLVYSHWQLLVLADLKPRLSRLKLFGPYERRRAVLPPLDEWTHQLRQQAARWARVLTAIEAVYLPEVVPEWLHLVNAEVSEWRAFRLAFDPIAAATKLGVGPDEVRGYAESLLSRARTVDPTGDWSRLIRRGSRESWKTLEGDALIALDLRIAAEILILFYVHIGENHAATPLPEIPKTVWHPLFERISNRDDGELDNLLARFGVSPHPGVVLVVEGEVEELLVPRVFDQIGLSRSPDTVQMLCMRGADKELPLVAAATAAPILGRRHGDSYELIRPPTRLVVAVDQDEQWNTPDKVERRRHAILSEIRKVVAAQSASVLEQDLQDLVLIRQWKARCFEFAHFTDSELAGAMAAVQPTCGGLSRDGLSARISVVRGKGLDIKAVWDRAWNPKPSKVSLAEALWPTLAAKIDAARHDADVEVPEVAAVVIEAYQLAKRSSIGNFVMRADLTAVE